MEEKTEQTEKPQRNILRTPNYMFVRRVLKSCKNLDQLSMAEKMIWQYATIVRLSDFKSAEDLQEIYRKKKQELETKGVTDFIHHMYGQAVQDIRKCFSYMNNYKKK